MYSLTIFNKTTDFVREDLVSCNLFVWFFFDFNLVRSRNEIGEEELRHIFSQYGTIKRFKFFEKDRKMALIEMNTIEEAIAALIVMLSFN
jgi:RNA recognition motif-containing protein